MRPQSQTCVVCHTAQEFSFAYQGHHYDRCPSCGLVSTYPLPDAATIEAHYARKFREGNYQLLRDYSEQYLGVYAGLARILRSLARPPELEPHLHDPDFRGLKVLDVGCFTGEFLELLQSQGADVYGLELQSEAVEIANRKLPGRVFQADVFSNDFPQMEFDILTLFGVIEHLLEPAKLLERASALLRSGGFVMVQTPDSASLPARALGKWWPLYAPVEHIHLFTRKSLESALGALGFTDIACRPHWKRLPVAYVHQMLQNYGPEFHRLSRPLYALLPRFARNMSLRFYGGEMIVTARKS